MKQQIKWDESKVEKLRQVWTSGTTKEINIAFSGLSTYYLRDVARRFKIKRGYEFKVKRKLAKLLDDNVYNNYWLGFIMADGHFSKKGELKISLSIKDFEHLTKFANYVNVKVHNRKAQTYGKYTSDDSCVVTVMDVNSVKELIHRFKLIGTKTYGSCSLDSLKNDDSFLSFFTGLVDGDGCITQSKKGKANMLRIQCDASWINVYTLIGERLKTLFNIDYKCYIDKTGYCKFAIYRNNDLVKIKKEIIKLSIPFLNRKWDKINE